MSTVGTLYEETVRRGFAKLLVTQTTSNVTSMDFIAPFTAAEVDKYSSYIFVLEGVAPVTDGGYMVMRMSIDNGANWVASSSYAWMWGYYGSTASTPVWNSTYNLGGPPYDTYMQFMGGAYPNYAISGEIFFANKSSPGVNNLKYCITYLPSGSGLAYTFRGAGANNTYSVINGVRFYMINSTLMHGTIRLYGLRKGT